MPEEISKRVSEKVSEKVLELVKNLPEEISTEVINELKKFADKQRAIHSQRYFKTGKGEYGENDKFIGVGGVIQRKIAQKFFDLDLSEVQKLLNSPIHEYRQTAVLILAYKYKKADDKFKKQIYNLYLSHPAIFLERKKVINIIKQNLE